MEVAASATVASSSKPLKIGILGFGNFGQFLATTMIKQGLSLTVFSRSDYSQLCSQMGITFFRDMDQFCDAGNDVLLICTSIISFPEVLRSIPVDRLQKETLFVDVLSVKELPRDLFLKVLLPESDILCTHPMFGPESGKEGWNGLPFVYDRVRITDATTCSDFLRIFESEGCRMVELSCKEHDKMAARTQFLCHTIGRVLSQMEIESTPMDTKGFGTLLQLRDNVTKDSFDLYCGLFKHNSFSRQEVRIWLCMTKLKAKSRAGHLEFYLLYVNRSRSSLLSTFNLVIYLCYVFTLLA